MAAFGFGDILVCVRACVRACVRVVRLHHPGPIRRGDASAHGVGRRAEVVLTGPQEMGGEERRNVIRMQVQGGGGIEEVRGRCRTGTGDHMVERLGSGGGWGG